jgi:hypothetical protein
MLKDKNGKWVKMRAREKRLRCYTKKALSSSRGAGDLERIGSTLPRRSRP